MARENYAQATELVVGFYKKESGRPSITYPEARDQALCFGWIDGIRRALDELSYTIRFTPRKPRSIWSNINIARVEALRKSGHMTTAGENAFTARDQKKSGIYAFENEHKGLDPAQLKQFQRNSKAWKFFQSQAPWYRRTSTYWVISAKKEETRAKRLAQLIADSAAGLRIMQLRRK